MRLPLFPLHSVLCPGVALQLHVFEPRYRRLISRCIEREEPFGVVLIRDGRETGAAPPQLATIGTTALIREASRYPDGRFDIMTVGGRRFRLETLVEADEPYLVGEVRYLPEPVGQFGEAERLARRVSQRFMGYLDLLQHALLDDTGPEIEVEIEIETDDPDPLDEETEAATATSGSGMSGAGHDAGSRLGSPAERRELLMAAARRLTAPGDPTALSYVLTGLVQVETFRRQAILEAPDTVARLLALDGVLTSEMWLFERGLKPLTLEPGSDSLRRN